MSGEQKQGSPGILRRRFDLSCGWEFMKRRAARDWLARVPTETGPVDLPHCWNETDTFREGLTYYRGPGSYRLRFELDPAALEPPDRAWLLESGGFYGTGDVWLNGSRIARVDGQYLGFRLTVPASILRGGDNVLGLRLTNRCSRDVLPGIRMPDFLLHGGAAGRIGLMSVPVFRLDAGTVRVRTFDVLTGAPRAEVDLRAVNDSGRTACGTIECELVDAAGVRVAECDPVPVSAGPRGESATVTVSFTALSVRLWSLEERNLYTVHLRLLEDDRIVDTVESRFGFRHAEFVPDRGFFLNGARTVLHGCNRHESMPGFGNALPEWMHRRDAGLLKEYGFNFVRLSHYPQHPLFLDACDELGILVCPEIATWKSVRTGTWLTNALCQMRDMVRRDRNHPGVILWGMGNESRSRPAYLALRQAIRELDPDRPVTYAENHLYRAKRKSTVGVPDVWGLNYEFDVLNEVASAGRLRNVVVTECSNQPHTVRGDLAAEARQVETILSDLRRIEGRDFAAGFALWCFNDYATLRKDRYLRHSGVFDAWRVPKMAAFLMRALGSECPLVKVFGLWRANPGGEPCRIHVVTNCRRIGISTASAQCLEADVGPYSVHQVAFEPGALHVTGITDGKIVARDSLSTCGPASAVEAVPAADQADPRGTLEIGVRVVDVDGQAVCSWNGLVTGDVSGPARLRSYRDDGGIVISRGTGTAFVSGTGREGEAVMRVQAEGLTAGEARVCFR